MFIFQNEISLSQNVQTVIYDLLKVFLSSMRTSTGSPLFSDFISDLSSAVRFPTAGQGNDDSGNEIGREGREGASLLLSPIRPLPTHHYQCDVT